MFISAEITTEYSTVNTQQIAAFGVFDDPNGKYFMLNILLANGQKITWKYDDKSARDNKAAKLVTSSK